MKNRFKNWLGNLLLDFIEAIYENRPSGAQLTTGDMDNIQRVRKMRKDFK